MFWQSVSAIVGACLTKTRALFRPGVREDPMSGGKETGSRSASGIQQAPTGVLQSPGGPSTFSASFCVAGVASNVGPWKLVRQCGVNRYARTSRGS